MRKDVEFKTQDGVTLRGWHYLPDQRSGKVPTIPSLPPTDQKKVQPMPTITTGPQNMAPEQYCEAVAQFEARAKQAEAHGLPHAAKSWRDRIASLPTPTSGAPVFVFPIDKTM